MLFVVQIIQISDMTYFAESHISKKEYTVVFPPTGIGSAPHCSSMWRYMCASPFRLHSSSLSYQQALFMLKKFLRLKLILCMKKVFSFAHYTMLLLQIHIDIPRMNPLIPLFQQTTVQEVGLKVNYFKLYINYL